MLAASSIVGENGPCWEIFKQSPVPSFVFDPQNMVLQVNQQYRIMAGLAEDSDGVIGAAQRGWLEAFSDPTGFLNSETEAITELSTQLITSNSACSDLPVRARIHTLEYDGKRIITGTVSPLTGMLAEQDQYLQILDSVLECVILLDQIGKIIFINSRAKEALGISGKDSVINCPLTHIQVHNLVFEIYSRISRVTMDMKSCEFECKCEIGGKKHLRVKLSPLKWQGESATLVMFVDESRQYEIENQYRKLFSEMNEGFAMHKIIFDESNKPVDYRFISVNPAFERLTGLPACAIIGKRVREILPDIEDSWIERYGKVVLEQQPTSFTQYSPDLDRHFSVSAYCTAPDEFACLFTDITTEKNNEALLRGKNIEWEMTFDAVPEIITILDNKHKIVNANLAATRLLKMPKEKIIGRHCYELFHGSTCPPDNCPHTMMSKDNESHRVQSHEVTLGRELDINVVPLTDKEGTITGSVHVVWDITEKKAADLALRESEKKFRLLFENMNVGFALFQMIFDPPGVAMDCLCLEANPSFERIIGVSLPQMQGKPLMSLFPYLRSDWLKTAQEVVLSGKAQTREFYFTEVQSYASVSFFSAGRERFAVIFDDITDKMFAAEQLRLKEAAIESSFNGIAIADIAGNIVYANQAFLDIWGYKSFAEVEGRPQLSFGSHELINDAVQTAIINGKWRGEGLSSQRLDGGEVYTNVSLSLVRDNTSSLSCLMAVVMNVTERKLLEVEAACRREQLIHADKLSTIGTLVACIMHEINNPVGVISLNIPIFKSLWTSLQPLLDEVAQQQPGLKIGLAPYEKIRAYVPQLLCGIEDGGERITRIIRRFKNFSSPEEKEEVGAVDANKIVQSVVQFLDNHIRKSTNNFHVNLYQNIPVISHGYPHRLEQVVINVIMNSCQALTSNEQAIEVQTRTDALEAYVIIEVRDEGCGISQDNLQMLATPFFTTKRKKGGSGLGLSICNTILKEHGGKLELSSEEGKGTTVRIMIPCVHS